MTAMPYADDVPLPGRPRPRFWSPGTAVLLGVLMGAIGFFAGVQVEKAQVSNSTTATGLSRGGAASTPSGGFAARFTGGANGTFGTVSGVSANSLFVTDATGNTLKVTFNPATKVTKSVGVSKRAIRPGDAVVIQGLKNPNGTISATSVNGTGARPGATSTSTSATSAVNSLFGGGG